jgi:tripartite-type tricarboxylate transporter receptor subunit TctC
VINTPRRALLAVVASVPAIARAQSLDATRPVRWIVPFTPGGGSDIASRVVTGSVSELPNAPRFVIDNRPGAGGNIGMTALAQSPPDGHTVGILSVATHGINPTLYPRLPFDPIADFTPVCVLNLQPVVVATRADSRIRDLADLLSQRGKEINLGSAGNGLSGHAAGELLRMRSGLNLVHVPYRGSSGAWTDLLGGRVDLVVDNISTAMTHVQAGTVRILGLTSRDPMPGVEAPVIASQLPGYVVDSWNVLGGPANMPSPIVNRFADLVTAGLRNPTMQARYAELRMVPPPNTTPAYAAQYISDQIAMWETVVRESGMRVD